MCCKREDIWVKVTKSPNKTSYYWNPVTEAISTHLRELQQASSWRAHIMEDGRHYWWNLDTSATQWDQPEWEAEPPSLASSPACASSPSPCRPSAWLATRGAASVVAAAAATPGAPPLPAGGGGEAAPPEQDRPTWLFTVACRGAEISEDMALAHAGMVHGSVVVGGGSSSSSTYSPQDPHAPLWVEVDAHSSESRQAYFWDVRSDTVVRQAPQGAQVLWRCCRTKGGPIYFVDKRTGDTTWDLKVVPPLATTHTDELREVPTIPVQVGGGRWIEEGAALRICGLPAEEDRYNDKVCQVVGFEDGKVVVELPRQIGGSRLRLRPEHLAPLSIGAIVELRGLATEALNGQVGTIDMVGPPSLCKYHVKLQDGTTKIVKATKLIAKSRLWDLDTTLCPGACLRWRGEQRCLFVDSTGHTRKYAMHLPLNFSEKQKQLSGSGKMRTWPMLLYLHGTGGSSFFGHSKKATKSIGMNHVAEHFFVVSPECDWIWKDRPGAWVTELVLEMRAAVWVDPTRIYLAGCSMGGMSTWEVGAERADLYAAMAPVAAHHEDDRTQHIASRLTNMPIHVVHARSDETCLMRKEEPLWSLLYLNNPRFQLSLAPFVDHCSMFEKALCDDTMIYKWLLQWKRAEGGLSVHVASEFVHV
mmetsp:Transcript_101045/g.324544  ORF Transcript_101045/g.324544 Transcript_101045/m.324544 type:complete len:644 (-) Transcript_101045:127-2058(-)